MENRLIFFASPAEQSENAETAKSETDVGDLRNAADDYARAEISAERGGHVAVADAERIGDSGDTPEFTKILMKNGAKKVKDAVAERNKNPTPENTEKLNAAVVELKNKIINFERRKFENAAAESEIKKLSSLPNAAALFKNLKINFQSKSKGGSIEYEWKPGDKNGVSGFGLEQKKTIAKALRERATTGAPEGVDNSEDLEALRDQLLSNSELPKSWESWLRNPEKGFPGATEKQKTLGYVVEWVLKNLPELEKQSATFRQISEHANANPAAAQKLSEKGARTSVENFREMSRTERNEVLKNYSEVLAGTDAELAKRAAEAGVADGADSQKIKTENTAAIEKAEAEKTAEAEKIAPKLQRFALDQKLAEKAAARERELENSGKNEIATTDEAANLRARAQSGEKVGFGEKLKNFFRRGEKTDESAAENSENDAGKKEEDFATRARREVAKKELGDPKNLETFEKSLGLRGVQKEEAAELSRLLALEKFDTETLRGQLTPEIKALLERRKADDEMKKAA